jgi:hypothetical protein
VCSAAIASADQTVVSATIYPSSQGSVSHPTVGLQALDSCPAYSGSNPIYLYPPGQPYQLPTTSWSLSTLITCGLQVPLSDVTSVQILNPSQGFEAPLSSTDLSDPSNYQDSHAPDALPAISVDGSENQATYTRPFRGGADDNARDQVTEDGAPITLVVYAGGPPLTVKASTRTVTSTPAATTAALSATVQTAGGAAVPPSALTWNWSFGDGATSALATPSHRFPAGSYDVTVQVTDVSSGAGGTATIQYVTPASPVTGAKTQTGGSKPTKSGSSAGTENGTHSKQPGGEAGSKQSSGPNGSQSKSQASAQTRTTTTTTNRTTATTTHAVASATTSSAATRVSAAATVSSQTTTSHSSQPPTSRAKLAAPAAPVARRRPANRPRAKRHTPPRRSPPAPVTPVVSGRLISDIATLPADSSPLVHIVPAAATTPPLLRTASNASTAPAVIAALAVIALLGLGAWREQRGQGRWRDLFSGH